MKLKELQALFSLRPDDSSRAIRKRAKKIELSDDSDDFRYKVQKDGKDALFKIGQHKHRTVSEVEQLDPEYLTWILQQPSYSEEIKDIIKYVRFGSFSGQAPSSRRNRGKTRRTSGKTTAELKKKFRKK